MAQAIYIVGTNADSGYRSYARRMDAPRELAAFASAHEATFAEARGDMFVPGLLFGEESPAPMSSVPVVELAALLQACTKGLAISTDAHEWQGKHDLWVWIDGSVYDWEKWPVGQLREFIECFDRRNDTSIVGRRYVERIELE